IGSSRDYSERVAAEIDTEVKNLSETGYAAAIDILKKHIDQLHLLAKYLLIHEKIDRDDFEKLMRGEMPESEFVEKSAEVPVENTENTVTPESTEE
ncbi:MAG: ATP-dependent zinc metalloprotease FtsH, partial [Ruminococcus sp.]